MPEITHQIIATNGINLHVAMAGDETAPLVMLLHGFPESWEGWKHQIPALVGGGFRVWAPDQRGYNLSDKPSGVEAYRLDHLAQDIIGLIDAAGVEKAFVIGHDWGALVAWWIALHHPERLNKLAILNVPHPTAMYYFVRSHPIQWLKSLYMLYFQLPWLPEWMMKRFGLRFLRLSGHAFKSADLSHYQQAWNQPGAATGMLNWYRALIRRKGMSEITDPIVKTPTLIIWGEQDIALDARLASLSLNYVAAGDLITIEEASHFVQHDVPDEVNVLLLLWLADALE